MLQPTDHARTEVLTALTPLIEPLRGLSETLIEAEAATVSVAQTGAPTEDSVSGQDRRS